MGISNVIIGVFLVTLALYSCDSGVEIENTPPEKLLCVSGSISPQDSIIYINVFKGQKIGALIRSDSAMVDNAQVIISDGKKSVNLLYNAEQHIYKVENPFLNIGAGAILYLNVTAPGQQAVEAKAVIPPKPSRVVLEDKRSGDNYNFTLKWNNDNAHKYYDLWADVKGEIEYEYHGKVYRNPLQVNIDTPGDNIYFPSDKQNIGLNEESGTIGNAYYKGTSDEVVLKVTVANMDETFFKFYQSYGNYQTWLENSREFVPNFREPMPIFSNIKNGTGYFSAYNSVTVTVKIK